MSVYLFDVADGGEETIFELEVLARCQDKDTFEENYDFFEENGYFDEFSEDGSDIIMKEIEVIISKEEIIKFLNRCEHVEKNNFYKRIEEVIEKVADYRGDAKGMRLSKYEPSLMVRGYSNIPDDTKYLYVLGGSWDSWIFFVER